MAGSTQLTAAEVLQHPEYPHVFWDLKPDQKGRLECGKGRGGPYHIAYEVHGKGPRHLCLIMGLGGLMSSWQRQIKDFGHTRASDYTVLVIDNLGMGSSDKPLSRYSTSNMARDVIEVLDHIGWTQPRSVHVCGISMGGMISQELAYIIPERVASLTLTSTAARIVNTTGFLENLANRVNMFTPKTPDQQLARGKANLYTPEYVSGPDRLECVVKPFPTAGDRFAAGELKKRRDPGQFTTVGFMMQAIAAGWHHKSAEQLKEIADKVGRSRICVVHGTEDKMISVPHSQVLVDELSKGAGVGKGVRYSLWEGQGHVIPIEKRKEFHDLLEEIMSAAEKSSETPNIERV